MNNNFLLLVLFDAVVALVVTLLLNREHYLLQCDKKREALRNKTLEAMRQNP